MTLALYSTILEPGLEMAPGFLISHQAHAETVPALQQ